MIRGQPLVLVKVTFGYRLLGTPVGSSLFTQSFIEEQVQEVEMDIKNLHNHIVDLQTYLRIFIQCTISHISHLLGADVMHHMEPDLPIMVWDKWDGPLLSIIDRIIIKFLARLARRSAILEHVMLIAQTSIGEGGLGLIYPSHTTVPDFVLIMVSSTQYTADKGFVLDNELGPVIVHDLIHRLY